MQADEAARKVRYSRHPAVLEAPLGLGEMALLGPSRESYFGLDGPAMRIWELIETPRTLDEICAALIAEFEVDAEECLRDTRQYLAELTANSLAVETAAG